MTQSIIVGILALLAGFGIGAWQSEDGMTITVGDDARVIESSDAVLAEDYVSMRPSIMSAASQSLSTDETNGLVYMREEEKLARDVYTTLYEKWGIGTFNNIAQSEQTHTESIRQLLEKYDLTDSVTDDSVGVFTNQDLQKLYNDLVAEGNESPVAALKVGALIEDLDIKDLKDQLALTDNTDITMVYENLQRGSRNHLRAFVRQLTQRGETYEPQYISIEEYNSIIGTNQERGTASMMGGNGSGGQRGWGGNGGGMMRGQ